MNNKNTSTKKIIIGIVLVALFGLSLYLYYNKSIHYAWGLAGIVTVVFLRWKLARVYDDPHGQKRDHTKYLVWELFAALAIYGLMIATAFFIRERGVHYAIGVIGVLLIFLMTWRLGKKFDQLELKA